MITFIGGGPDRDLVIRLDTDKKFNWLERDILTQNDRENFTGNMHDCEIVELHELVLKKGISLPSPDMRPYITSDAPLQHYFHCSVT